MILLDYARQFRKFWILLIIKDTADHHAMIIPTIWDDKRPFLCMHHKTIIECH